MNDSHQLAVLNPGGRDPDQDFPDGPGHPDPSVHAPVNYHGYASSAGGSFLQSVDSVKKRGVKNVILLLRSDLKSSLTTLRRLKDLGCRVWLSFKESGLHQVSQTLAKSNNSTLLVDLCREADGALSSTEDLVAIYEAAGAKTAVFIPTPYPVEDSRWIFSLPESERAGIFIGTREFDVPTRNHRIAVSAALGTGFPVTVVNDSGRAGRKQIEAIGAAFPKVSLQIIEGRRAYPDYLRTVAKHRVVWQWDLSSVPGQIAGDALLCGIPCVGGNGAVERLVFPELTGHGKTLSEAVGLLRRLMEDDEFYRAQCTAAYQAGLEKAGFNVVRQMLVKLMSS